MPPENRRTLEAAVRIAQANLKRAHAALDKFWREEFKAFCKKKDLCTACGERKGRGVKRTWSMRARGGMIPDFTTHDPVRNAWVRKVRARARETVKRANFKICPKCKKARDRHNPDGTSVEAYRQENMDEFYGWEG
jgi:hypothetical protein